MKDILKLAEGRNVSKTNLKYCWCTAIVLTLLYVRLQGHVLGYCYRQKVVHKVRTTYEQVVSEIQPQNDFSFADEVVDWPSEVELCYPVFQDIKNIVEGTGIRDTPHDKVHGNKAALHRDCRCAGNLMAPQVNQVVEGGLVFDRDRESLLEIRSKLGMELVWLKQAITSRQKVTE